MRALDIPQWLFMEFLPKVRLGKVYRGLAKSDLLDGSTWNLVRINPTMYPNVHGDVGAMGWQGGRYEVSRFAIWPVKPEGNIDSISEPLALFLIKAIVKNGREQVTAHFPFSYGANMESYLMPLVADVLRTTNEMLRANLIGVKRP